MKSNQFEFHEHELSKKNKPINNQRQKPQTHDSKQKKPKEKDRKEKEKKLPRNSRIDQEKKKEDSKEKQWYLQGSGVAKACLDWASQGFFFFTYIFFIKKKTLN